MRKWGGADPPKEKQGLKIIEEIYTTEKITDGRLYSGQNSVGLGD